MQRLDGRFIYAASDLNNYLECKRLIELDELAVWGKLAWPTDDDPTRELIRRKGQEHEQRYLKRMQAYHGDGIVIFERSEAGIENYRNAEEQTLEAMRSGARVIYQATFFDGRFLGHADFLRRVEIPSALGSWSYEVVDTKLALSPKPYFLVQLCNYSEHLERLQEGMPEFGYVVLGDGDEQRFRLHDYVAYYRHLKSTFLAFVSNPHRVDAGETTVYPVVCKHCTICPWEDACAQKRIDDDHLSLVAWMRRDQIGKFEPAGITTVNKLAEASDANRPSGMSEETFAKLRRQASLQVRGRNGGPLYELLPHVKPMGFGMLPESARGDVFFDMEGDPLFEPGRSLEYLFGCWLPDDDPHFRAFWALDRVEEKRAFEAFVDFIVERRRRYPTMHVYHYAPYEKSAMRRLAQEHATREDKIDDLLRGEVLVDLFAVVRQALAISEDSYGLKNIEHFYDFKRSTEVKKGDESVVMFERWLLERDQKILADIEAYNRDDCYSTFLLRKWLLERREEAITLLGLDLPFRPVKTPGEPCHAEFDPTCKKCEARRAEEREELRRSEVERELRRDILPPGTDEEYRLMAADVRIRYLLANLLAYHRREAKPEWWAFFDRCENVDELLEFDKEAIAGLVLREDVPAYKLSPRDRNLVYTYTFPDQLHKMTPGAAYDARTRNSAGQIVEVDDENNKLLLKRGSTFEDARAVHELIPRPPLDTVTQQNALARVAQLFLDGELQEESRATFDLLASNDPRVPGFSKIQPEPVAPENVSAVLQALDRSYLFIQGPPGTGKTTTASYVICDLLERDQRIGVMSTSHKAIQHLLNKVEADMLSRGKTFRGLYKCGESNSGEKYESQLATPFIQVETNYDPFEQEDYHLAAGTSWLFAREKMLGTFDYLFIDEAGQVSLADTIAVSACARNVVLFGDPSQLAQVSQGKHPLHVDDSALEHLLGDAKTVPPHRGVFLDISHRMQPEICAFISDAMYEGRLQPDLATAIHRVTVNAEKRSGLSYMPVEHSSNSAYSVEEADRIVVEIARMRTGTMIDSQPREVAGLERPIEDDDIIVVTPYNAQRRLITRKLKEAGLTVEVGTVDKFQGREAAVVFYSMATSSSEDAPRDMEFLFERNRFNVAVSRARTLSVLVCSPRLLDIACQTPNEMALANILCAFVEAASAGAARSFEQLPV